MWSSRSTCPPNLVTNATVHPYRVQDVTVFDSYQDFLSSDPDSEAAAAVAEVLGEEWIEEID
jgi:hypothetical protein